MLDSCRAVWRIPPELRRHAGVDVTADRGVAELPQESSGPAPGQVSGAGHLAGFSDWLPA